MLRCHRYRNRHLLREQPSQLVGELDRKCGDHADPFAKSAGDGVGAIIRA
jgi:hypothetical protein